MEAQQPNPVNIVSDMLQRRKALIASCILIALAIGLGYYLKQPKIYQSTSLLTYQQQAINPARMSPDAQERINDVVSTLSQIILSRTSLEKIINTENLYQGLRERLPMEDVVTAMRNKVEIVPSRRGDTFNISFSGSDPKTVAKVTNALALRFIEENLKYREERASDTSVYTQNELEMAKEMLDTKEASMRDYKLKFYNEMPDQMDNNMSRLNALQGQYQSRQESIQDLSRTSVLIRDQLAVRKQLLENNLALNQPVAATRSGQRVQESDEVRLRRLQLQLEEILTRYTEQHPRVKSLRRQIVKLEDSIAQDSNNRLTALEQNNGSPGQSENQGNSSSRPQGQFDETAFELEVQLKGIALNIDRLNKEKDSIKKQIEQYEEWISRTPVREAEWSSLTREYDELRNHYDFLVSQNLQATSALNLERKQKGSQFKIADPAVVPVKPIKPEFLKIIGMALAAGCGLGGGLAFLLTLLDTSFKRPEDLESSFGFDVLATVPKLSLKKELLFKRAISAGGVLFFTLWGAAVLGAFYYFYQRGQIIL